MSKTESSADLLNGSAPHRIEVWQIDRLVFYGRNPRNNDAAVDRMCASIREFGFKIPVLARSSGEVVDGHQSAPADFGAVSIIFLPAPMLQIMA